MMNSDKETGRSHARRTTGRHSPRRSFGHDAAMHTAGEHSAKTSAIHKDPFASATIFLGFNCTNSNTYLYAIKRVIKKG